MKATTSFEEQLQFMGPTGLTAALNAAALQEHTTRSEFVRRAIFARLREVGVPLEPGKRAEADRSGSRTCAAGVLRNEAAALKTSRPEPSREHDEYAAV